MRVITGEARGKKLSALVGDEVTRPTTDMVKEAMFSIIQFDVPGAGVLDLFAGSGQLGIEALSRGAAHCVFVERDRDALAVIKQNIMSCGFNDRSRVLNMDALEYLRVAKKGMDIVLLDPPYRQGLIGQAMQLLPGLLNEGATVICEHEKGLELDECYGALTKYRSYRYGKISLTVYKMPSPEES